MTCVAFSIKFVKLNQKFAENSEFCEKKITIIQNYSLHSLGGVIDESHIDKYLAKDLEDTAYSRGLGRTGNLVEKKQFVDPRKMRKSQKFDASKFKREYSR